MKNDVRIVRKLQNWKESACSKNKKRKKTRKVELYRGSFGQVETIEGSNEALCTRYIFCFDIDF